MTSSLALRVLLPLLATALVPSIRSGRAPRRVVLAASSDEPCPPEMSRLHEDEAARKAASPRDILRARYWAYVEKKPEFIMDTTHPSNVEYTDDRDGWAAKIVDFASAVKFVHFQIFDDDVDEDEYTCWRPREFYPLSTPRGDETAPPAGIDPLPAPAEAPHVGMITWNARMNVLEGMVDDSLVETKDFIERSLLVLGEDGGWLYMKGDPDYKPRNIRVDGPLEPKPSPPAPKKSASRVPQKVSR